jgi:hypothetical protein
MRAEEAKVILQKYFEGETTLEEERSLRDFFRKEEIPSEFLPYRLWFAIPAEPGESVKPDAFTREMAAMIRNQQPPVRILNRKVILTFSGIAASLLIVVTSLLMYLKEPVYQDTFSDPAEAAAYAEKTLHFVSEKYNRGLATLAPVSRLKAEEKRLGENLKTIRKGFNEYNKIKVINKLNATD